jgi:hypothetical protein
MCVEGFHPCGTSDWGSFPRLVEGRCVVTGQLLEFLSLEMLWRYEVQRYSLSKTVRGRAGNNC